MIEKKLLRSVDRERGVGSTLRSTQPCNGHEKVARASQMEEV